MPKRVGSSAVKMHEFDGAAGLESELLQNADGFEAAEHADAAVVEAGIGNGVDVGAGADGRQVRFGALPAGEGVADGVFGDGEAGVARRVLLRRRGRADRLR